jgi:hypothetical protein
MDGKFSQTAWTTQNYPSLIDRYFTSGQRVPMYLVSGDHDSLGIAFETALFFKRMFEKQPDFVEMRMVDGGHSWPVWSNAVDDAVTYLFRFTSRSGSSVAIAQAGTAGNTVAQAVALPSR